MKYLSEYNGYVSWGYQGSNSISIMNICAKYYIKNYVINDSGFVDVNGDVNLRYQGLGKLPIKFGNVSGDFTCFTNELMNLEGAPLNIGGDFSCGGNRLTNLKGAPQTISGSLYCHSNFIRDIYYIPKVVGSIIMDGNPVHSLIKYFIRREDKQEWIDLFNELDIIQDGYNVILDRLKYFYEGTKLDIDITPEMLDEIKYLDYKIIN